MKSNIYLASSTSKVIDSLMSEIGSSKLTMAIITTATEPVKDKSYYEADKQAIDAQKNLQTFEYTLTDKSKQRLTQDLTDVDIIYVVGGNVFYLLQQAQKSGFAAIVHKHVTAGKIYIGQSAGSIIAGPNIWPARRSDMVDKAPDIQGYEGFGIVNFITLPHWGEPKKRELYFKERLPNVFNEDYIYVPLTDNQYISFSGSGYRIVDVSPKVL